MAEHPLRFFHDPGAVAIVGASDDPDKIGGRPLRYLRQFGYRGTVFPINRSRPEVQGVPTSASLEDLPIAPDVAVIAVAGRAAVEAVEQSAALGVRGCVILASGFTETGQREGRELQRRMDAAAAATGMRVIGPNTQGLANFATGAVLGFSTMFLEEPPADGPIGIVSQSGAMCSVTYGLLRRRGLGVRYADASGNDADVTVGELVQLVVSDPEVRLVLCYLEDVRDPQHLEQAAELAAKRDVPLVALMGGRSNAGKRAAASHTGAIANEHRIVDAFFERAGIWRARSVNDLLAATELYLRGWEPRGRRLAVASNSGAACVLAADAAADHDLVMAELAPSTIAALEADLPAFAAKRNPVDVTAALLTDSSLVGKVLAPMADDPGVDVCLLAIPVSGRGYDYERFAADAADFAAKAGKPLVVTTPQAPVAASFVGAGCIVFEEEYAAVGALAQFVAHAERRGRARLRRRRIVRRRPQEAHRMLNEAQSLDLLRSLHVPVVPHVLCADVAAVVDAFEQFGAPVVVKGCTPDVTHKSDLGLVHLGLVDATAVAAAARACLQKMADAAVGSAGVLVAPMESGLREALLGAHLDPVFGPVVALGAGGKYVEAVPDVVLLLPPFDEEEALRAIWSLRWAPLLRGTRGEAAATVEAWAHAAVLLGDAMADPCAAIESVDANPLLLRGRGSGVVVLDAVVQLGEPDASAPAANQLDGSSRTGTSRG